MKKLLLIALLCAPCFAFGQQAVIDSLFRELPKAKVDTTRIMLLLKINSVYSNAGNFDSALLYLNQANKLAEEKEISGWVPRINTAFILYYYNNNDYNKTKEYALKNLAIAEKNKDDILLAKAYNNLTAVFTHFGNNRQAIDYALKCLAMSEKTKDSADFPSRYATVSNTYLNLNQNESAISYAQKAIELGALFHDTLALVTGLNNLAAAYSGEHKLDSAIYYGNEQVKLAQQSGDVANEVYGLINLCYRHFLLNNLPGVEKTLAMLSKVQDQMPDKSILAEMYVAKALRYILRKEYKPAQSLLDSCIVLATSEKAMNALGNAYRSYSKMLFMQGKIKEAEDYAYKFDALQSEANINELNFYIKDMEVKYETEKKEDQIKLQQATIRQKSTLNYILIGSALSILIISLLSYRNYNHRQKLQQAKIDELETEKQLTATEAILKGEEKERSRLAQDLHDGLGGMLSGIKYSLNNMKENLIMTPANAQAFEYSISMLDNSINEMRRVAHNLMPESLLKFGLDAAMRDFCSEMQLNGMLQVHYQSVGLKNKSIDQSLSVTVYRITQELLNNIIKHAGATQAVVQIGATEEQLTITVEDNGKGLADKAVKTAQGIGWKNIHSRVNYHKGSINIQSQPDKGTSVFIEFPLV